MHTKIFSSLLLFVIGLSSTTLGSIVIGTTFTEYRNVAYNLSPGQVMDIYVPTGKKLNPTIILIHGGAWIGGDKLDLSTIAGLLVREGFTVANINYRLATVDSNQYPAAVKDAESVVEWLQSNAAAYRVDTSRIAAFGTSAGANLALTLGTFNRVKAVVDFYGPTDFTDPAFWADSLNGVSNSQILDLYLGVPFSENPTLYQSASPVHNISAKTAPTIIFHGSADQSVPVTESETFSHDLQSIGILCPLNIEPGLAHGFLTASGYDPTQVLKQSVDFLNTVMP
jgi:acetyl esterase/lipase